MNAQLFADPVNFLDENFDPEELHPADLAQLIEAGADEYETIPKFTRLKKLYRQRYNELVDCLSEKRGFIQFSHL